MNDWIFLAWMLGLIVFFTVGRAVIDAIIDVFRK